jgi:hypothetical protein
MPLDKFLKDSLLALQKKSSGDVLSYTENYNIFSKMMTLFVNNFVDTEGVFGVHIYEYNTHKTVRRPSKDIILDGETIQRLIDHFDKLPRKRWYNIVLSEYSSLVSHDYFENDGQYIGLDSLEIPPKKTNFNKDKCFNVTINTTLVRYKIIESVSVKNKFNIHYDIYYKNGVKYITTFELTDILLIDPQDTVSYTIHKVNPNEAYCPSDIEKKLKKLIKTNDAICDSTVIKYDRLLQLFDEDIFSLNIYEIMIDMMLKFIYLKSEDKTEYNDKKSWIDSMKDIIYKIAPHSNECQRERGLALAKIFSRYRLCIRFFLQMETTMRYSGVYNITTRPFYVTKKNNKKIQETVGYDVESISKILTADEIVKYNHDTVRSSKKYKTVICNESWNNLRSTFIYKYAPSEFELPKCYNDDELVNLFTNTDKTTFKKVYQNTEQVCAVQVIKEKEVCPVQAKPTQANNTFKKVYQNIREFASPTHNTFIYKCVVSDYTKSKIEYLLTDLIQNNIYFTSLFYKYDSTIEIVKGIDKAYTNAKYINIRFGKDTKSKQYHCYLNFTNTAITNITHIESIDIH